MASIVASDLKAFLSVNNPENDASNSGGIIQDELHANGSIRCEIVDLAAADTVTAVSGVTGGADQRSLTITGRNAGGTIVAQTLPLNGTTPVVFSGNTFERIMKVEAASKNASNTVTVTRTTGGASICTLPPNCVAVRRMFYDAASSSSGALDRYEGHYFKSINTTNSLNAAAVTLTVDALNHLTMVLAAATGDISSPGNRLLGPGLSGYVDNGAAQTVPGGTLAIGPSASGSRIFVWLKQSLAQSAAAFKDSFTTQIAGTTT